MARMVCIGPGPGPKNVLVEYSDGRRMVVPYAIWKHRISKESELSDKVYRTVVGIVQFEPKEGEAAGKPVRNIVIRQVGFKEQSTNVYVTVWPSHADIELERNDVVIVEGTYNQGKGQDTGTGAPRIYHNISATRLAKLGAASDGKKPEVENDDSDPDTSDDDIPF